MMSNIMYPWYDNSNTEDSSETKKSEKETDNEKAMAEDRSKHTILPLSKFC